MTRERARSLATQEISRVIVERGENAATALCVGWLAAVCGSLAALLGPRETYKIVQRVADSLAEDAIDQREGRRHG